MNDTVCLCHINTLPHLEINPETKKGAGFFSEHLSSPLLGTWDHYTPKNRGQLRQFQKFSIFSIALSIRR